MRVLISFLIRARKMPNISKRFVIKVALQCNSPIGTMAFVGKKGTAQVTILGRLPGYNSL